MTIIATAPIPVFNRLDMAPTAVIKRGHYMAPAVLARAADAVVNAGVEIADAAAILGVSADEVIELMVDHACRAGGASWLVGMRCGIADTDGDL